MFAPQPKETFRPLRTVARQLGVPSAWLKAEAEAGRVPVLRAGRRFLFNPEAVQQILLKRTAGGEVAHV
jgi:hypothetical protein